MTRHSQHSAILKRYPAGILSPLVHFACDGPFTEERLLAWRRRELLSLRVVKWNPNRAKKCRSDYYNERTRLHD